MQKRISKSDEIFTKKPIRKACEEEFLSNGNKDIHCTCCLCGAHQTSVCIEQDATSGSV
jgi:hypothetical protein